MHSTNIVHKNALKVQLVLIIPVPSHDTRQNHESCAEQIGNTSYAKLRENPLFHYSGDEDAVDDDCRTRSE